MQDLIEAKRMQFGPGSILQNGRLCLLYDGEEYDGVTMGYDANNVMPYATWRVYWTQGIRGYWFGSTVWGHYFPDFESAYEDYCERRDEIRARARLFSGVV